MTKPPQAAQVLTINDWLPEQLANGPHSHWSVRQRKLNAAQVMVWSAARMANWQPVTGKARLTITFVFPQRRARDVDNLYSRAKGCIDGLKTHTLSAGRGKARAQVMRPGWIVDDSIEYLELRVLAEVRPGVKCVEMMLEGIE